MIKAVFFDIDGTLLDHETHLMPVSTLKALKKLKEQEIKVFIATGRTPSNLTAIKEIFEFDGFVSSNGQYCFNKQEVIFEKYIDQQDIKQILPYINQNNIPVLFAELYDNYSNIYNYRIDDVAKALEGPRFPIRQPEQIIGNKIIQLMAYIDECDDAKFLEYMPHCKSARWSPLFADIIPSDGGKNKGIDKMIEHYNISLEEVMAFGDGNNDIDMLKHVGIGVAMGNANDQVKVASDYVTSDINDDGIYKALIHFGLISE